jgi:flagellar biosynthesis chaperone FliJ
MKDKYEKAMQQLENERNKYDQLKNEVDQRGGEGQDTANYRQQATELASKLTMATNDAKTKEKTVVELNETLRHADRKNRILLELIEYQKGPIDNEVDDLLS